VRNIEKSDDCPAVSTDILVAIPLIFIIVLIILGVVVGSIVWLLVERVFSDSTNFWVS
jgi:uncharacterized membrane protein